MHTTLREGGTGHGRERKREIFHTALSGAAGTFSAAPAFESVGRSIDEARAFNEQKSTESRVQNAAARNLGQLARVWVTASTRGEARMLPNLQPRPRLPGHAGELESLCEGLLGCIMCEAKERTGAVQDVVTGTQRKGWE